MSTLRYRKTSNTFTVYLEFTDQHRRRHCKSLKLSVPRISYKNNKPIYPLEAWDIKKQIDTEIALNTFHIKKYQHVNLTLSDILARYLSLDGKDSSPGTKASYKATVDLFTIHTGVLPITAVTEEMVVKFHNTLALKSKSTMARHIRVLKLLFNFALRRNFILQSPVPYYLSTQSTVRLPAFLSESEKEIFYKHILTHNLPLFYQLEFLLLTGFRSTESCLLTWPDILFELDAIKHTNIKRQSTVTLFPLSAYLRDLFLEMPRTYAPCIFKYRSRSSLYHALQQNLTASGIDRKGITIHSFKKQYATRLASMGVPITTLKDLAHHKSIATTANNYIFTQLNDMRTFINAYSEEHRRLTSNLRHGNIQPVNFSPPQNKKAQ